MAKDGKLGLNNAVSVTVTATLKNQKLRAMQRRREEGYAVAVQLIKNEGLSRDAWIWFLSALIGSCLLELQVAGPPHRGIFIALIKLSFQHPQVHA